jgi:hypothetical protein
LWLSGRIPEALNDSEEAWASGESVVFHTHNPGRDFFRTPNELAFGELEVKLKRCHTDDAAMKYTVLNVEDECMEKYSEWECKYANCRRIVAC